MGHRCDPSVNLKSNTMKNTWQSYKLYFMSPSNSFIINTCLTLYMHKKGYGSDFCIPFWVL